MKEKTYKKKPLSIGIHSLPFVSDFCLGQQIQSVYFNNLLRCRIVVTCFTAVRNFRLFSSRHSKYIILNVITMQIKDWICGKNQLEKWIGTLSR